MQLLGLYHDVVRLQLCCMRGAEDFVIIAAGNQTKEQIGIFLGKGTQVLAKQIALQVGWRAHDAYAGAKMRRKSGTGAINMREHTKAAVQSARDFDGLYAVTQ